ncbi:MAG: thiamine ABC transporter substrate-binding protein [Treponema sp.]
MKSRLYLFLFLVCSVILPSTAFAGGKTDDGDKTVVVYTYDSFAAEWGPGPEIAKRFKEQTGYTVQYVICEDSGAVLSKAIAEKKNPRADVLLGINTFLVDRVRKEAVLEPYHSPNIGKGILKSVIMTDDHLLTPYDWGYFTVMYDSGSKLPPPQSLEDLTKPEYAKSLVIMDPRTSAPGLGFAAWTKAVYGNDYLGYWKRLMPSILTMSHSWSAGYGLFTAGEAPLVVSYTTSMAYHIRYDNTDRYKALSFPEGHILEIEGMGLVKNAPHRAGGQAFIDFMLSERAQEVLPETQWMYPVNTNVRHPESFKAVPLPKKALTLSGTEAESAVDPIISVLGN